MLRLWLCLCVLLVTLPLSSNVLLAATAPATDTPVFGSVSGGPDTINNANLNAHWSIPIILKNGRKMPFYYILSYDSSIWTQGYVNGVLTWQPVGNWGWRAQTEVAVGYVQYSSAQRTCSTSTGGTLSYTSYNFTSYHDQFGISHPFSLAVVGSNALHCYPSLNNLSATGTTTDGSGYTMSVTSSPSAKVYPRAGSTILPPLGAGTGAGNATDTNGNEISTSDGSHFIDTLGKTVLTVSGLGTATSPLTFAYPQPTNPAVTVPVYAHYTNKTVQTAFGCSGVAEYAATTVSLITDVTFPDGSKYTFQYEPTPGTTSGNVTGRLQSVTLPTGGTVTYTYSGGSHGIVCSDGSTAGFTRQTPDGSWTYARTQGSGAAWTTTITDPQNNQTVLQFQGIYETERDMYQGLTSGTLLRTVYTCYNAAATPCNGTAITLPVTRRDVTTKLPNGMESRNTTLYDSTYTLPTEVDEYDFGSAGIGAPIRKTLTSYGSWNGSGCTVLGNNIVDHPCQVTVEDSGSTIKAQTSFTYDQGTVVTTSGTPQHSTSITGSRGNPTTIAYMVASGNTLSKTFTYFDTGNIDVETDVNGAQKTYNYPDATSTCGNSFPTSISLPLSLSTSATWQCDGGAMLSSTDLNGKTVSTAYNDPDFWRPTSTTDQASNATNFTYTTTSFESELDFNSGASTVDLYQTVDSLGRPLLSQQHQSPTAANWDTVWHSYDSVGRSNKVSVPYSCSKAGSCSGTPTVNTSYDAIGRITQTLAADGVGTVSNTYTDNDILTTTSPAPTGENTKRKQLEYDGLGRLTSVCELTSATGSGSCSQTVGQTGYWTKYTYDALDNLTGVTQNAQSSSTQTRSYTYDGLGRLTLESNPESGGTATPTKYTYDSDATCGTSKGDLVKRVDAVGNVTCYAYDALHRVKSITYPSGAYASATPAKTFVYDSATVNGVVMANTGGRLAEAYTGSSTSPTTDIGFVYSVRGELTEIWESTPNSGGYYHPTAAFWPNGALSNLWISKIPSISYGTDGEGRISTVSASSGTNPVTATSYNVASQLTSATFGSTDSISYTYDSNTGRMTQYKLTINGSATYGNLTWNPNGSLQKLAITDPFNTADAQTCTYLYDDLGRIGLPPGSTGKSVDCGASIWQQNFSYDAFGNLTKTIPSGGTGVSWQPTYSTSTNRYTAVPGASPSYDADGNLTNDSFHSYTWDAEGRPVTVDVLGLTYDALGRMVEVKNGTNYTQYVWWPSSQKFVIMNGQTLSSAFVPLPGGAEVKYLSSGLSVYRMADWLGSLRAAANPNRTYNGSLAYAPFGERYALSGTPAYDFTGQRPDTISDEYDFMFRKYHSTQGRWISPDPAGLAAVNPANPQSWNRYAYVAGNPLGNVDPLGLECAGAKMTAHGSNSCWAPASGGSGSDSICNLDGVDTPCGVVGAVGLGGGLINLPVDPVAAGGLVFMGVAYTVVPDITGALDILAGGNEVGSEFPLDIDPGGDPANNRNQPDKESCGTRLAHGIQQRTGTAISNVQYAGTVGGHKNYTFDVFDPAAFQSVLNQNPAWPLPFGLDTGYRYGAILSTHIHDPLSATGSYSGHTDLFGGHSFLLPLHLIVDLGIGHIPGVNLDFGCIQ